jgi:hypothetical protein
MAEEKTPGWMRGLEILFALIGIILAGATFILFDQYLQYLLFTAAIALFGLLWLIRAISYSAAPSWLRGLAIIFGIVLIVLASATPLYYLTYNGWLLAGALILEGFSWILWMLVGGPQGAIKWLGTLLGLLQLIIAAVVFAFPVYTMWLIAGATILSGLILLFKGIAGQ